ncbi:MAG: CinA family protein [Promethearchaeota archaeon]
MEILERIETVIKRLAEKNILVAIAKSYTRGYLFDMITNFAGSLEISERGIIFYRNQAKIDVQNGDSQMIENFGAVLEEIAGQMAYRVKVMSKPCDIGIGVISIAGPTGGPPEKPLGLVYIGFSTAKEVIVKKFLFKIDQITFKKKLLEEV